MRNKKQFIIIETKGDHRFAGTLKSLRKDKICLENAVTFDYIDIDDSILDIANNNSEHIEELELSTIIKKIEIYNVILIVEVNNKAKKRIFNVIKKNKHNKYKEQHIEQNKDNNNKTFTDLFFNNDLVIFCFLFIFVLGLFSLIELIINCF